jgi:F420-0:gamma-glutamyl ligase
MKTMQVTPIHTPIFHIGDSLVDFIVNSIDKTFVAERLVLAITTKIVSLAEQRLVAKNSIDKKALTISESEIFLGEIGHGVSLAIKHSLLLPGAGIDESNSENGDYILHPLKPMESALKIRRELLKRWQLKELGIILTDSRSGPLRLGITGAAIACAGFRPVLDKVGDKDLFGRPLKITKVNVADSLAASAVLLMGEADESCPLALIKDSPAEFMESFDVKAWQLSPAEDMYSPLYAHLIKPL